MAGEIQYGVTPPLSTELPKDPEKRANDALFAELKAQNTYEHATETQKRYAAQMQRRRRYRLPSRSLL